MQTKFLKPALLFLFLVMSQMLFGQANAYKPVLVGYFGQWGLYSDPQYTMKDLARTSKAGMLDQLNYAQAFVTGGHCSIADRNADLDHAFTAAEAVNGVQDATSSTFHGYLHQLAELKQAQPRLKTMISLEGRASDFALNARPENRQAFVASCVELFLEGNLAPGITVPGLFDGIDVDWEYPQGADAENFLALLSEFRHQMDLLRPGLKLSIAVGASPRMYAGTDFRAISGLVDEVGLMTYDMAGPWMQTTGFIAPLYRVPSRDPGKVPMLQPTPTGANPTASTTPAATRAVPAADLPFSKPAPRTPPAGGVAGSVQAYLAAGVPAQKLLVGVPFYGYGWTQVPEEAEGLYQEGVPVRGDRPYSYISNLVTGSNLYRDPESQTPWLFDGDAFWTFDDPISVEAKATYALEHSLGGLMIWELSNDTQQGALLRAAHRGLTRSLR